MLRLILGFFSGPLTRIGERLIDAKVELAKAETAERKIELETQVAQLEARERVLIAEQRHALTRLIRPAFAYPCAFYWGKIWVWDKALGLGVTDPIDERLWWISLTIIGAYFLTRPFEKRR